MFVIDSSDAMRMAVASNELQLMIQHPQMKNRAVPILILANKSDLDNAVPCHQVKFFGRSGKNGRHGAKTFWNSSSTSPPTFGQKRVPSLKPYRGREPFLSFEKKKNFSQQLSEDPVNEEDDRCSLSSIPIAPPRPWRRAWLLLSHWFPVGGKHCSSLPWG